MVVQEDLQAIFAAENGVSPVLEDIATDALEAAAGLETLEAAADAAEGAIDTLERSAASVIPSLEATEAQIEGVGDEALRSAAKVEALDASLSDLDTATLADLPNEHETAIRANVNDASFLAAGARLDTLTRDRTVDVAADLDHDSFSIPRLAGSTVPFAAGGVSAPDVSPDARTIPFDTGDVVPPSLSPDARSIPVSAELDESSVAAARSAIAALPDDHTVRVAADLDASSIATVESAITSLGGDRSIGLDVGVDQPGGIDAPAMPDLSGLQFPATDGGTELTALGGAGHVAAEGLDAASSSAIEASAATALAASEADDAGDGFLSIVPGGEAASSALDGVRSSAFAAVPGLSAAGSAADEYGDEASEAAVETAALQTSMAGLGSSGVGTEFLGFHGSLSSIATLLPAIISLVGGLVAPLGAVAVSGGAAGGALAAVFGAGMLGRAEQMVGTYQEVDGELKRIENTGEAVGVVLGNIKDRAGDIFAQLQTGQASQFFTGLTEGGFAILEDAVGLTNRLLGPLTAMSARLGEVFAATEPEGFAELEATTRAFLPTIESLVGGAMRALPDFLRWIRTEGLDTADALLSLAGSALDLGVELAEVGGVVWSLLAPALGAVFDVASGVLGVFTDLPDRFQRAGVVAAAAAGGAYLLAGALTAVELSAIGISTILGALGGALAAISWPVVAVGALAGAAYLLADNFGLIDTAASAVTGTIDWLAGSLQTLLGLIPGVSSEIGILGQVGQAAAGVYNTVLDVIEGVINMMLNMPDWTMLIPGIGQVIALAKGGMWVFQNWGEIMQWVGQMAQKAASIAAGAWGAFTSFIGSISSWIVEGFEEMVNAGIDMINKLADAASELPGVNIKTGLESDFEVGDVSTGMGGMTEGPVDLSGMKVGQGGTAAQGARGGPGGTEGPPQPPTPGSGGAGTGGYGGAGTGGYGGQTGGTAAASGGGTTVENTVNYYESNNDTNSETQRVRRVRSIVRDMNDETRRAGTGMN